LCHVLASTDKASNIKVISYSGEHVATVNLEKAKCLLAIGLCFAGGTRSRLKYIRFKSEVREPEPQPVLHRPQFHEWHQKRGILTPGPEWLLRNGYELEFGITQTQWA